METLLYNCRLCKKVTSQLVRVITENLPPNVKTIECTSCGCMTVAMIGGDDGQL